MKLLELLAKNPLDIDGLEESSSDLEILRLSIIAEYDAISLYEQFALVTKNEKIQKILLDIAKEEKTHVGELETLLEEFDQEHANEVESARGEVKDKAGEGRK